MEFEKEWKDYAGPKGFWGFGPAWKDASIIFFGPEFGGGKNVSEVKRRIKFWREHTSFVEFPEFDKAVSKNAKASVKGNLGIRTFRSLIAVLVGSDKEDCREYMKKYFGTKNERVSWSDLSALPCRNLSHGAFRMLYRMKRLEYESRYLPARIKEIQDAFANLKGKTIILYGSSPLWPIVFPGDWKWPGRGKHPIGKMEFNRNKVFWIAHGNKWGQKLRYFEKFGKENGIDRLIRDSKARA